jgi:hypothetical protein
VTTQHLSSLTTYLISNELRMLTMLPKARDRPFEVAVLGGIQTHACSGNVQAPAFRKRTANTFAFSGPAVTRLYVLAFIIKLGRSWTGADAQGSTVKNTMFSFCVTCCHLHPVAPQNPQQCPPTRMSEAPPSPPPQDHACETPQDPPSQSPPGEAAQHPPNNRP